MRNNDPKTITLKSSDVSVEQNRTGDFSTFMTVRVPKGYRYVFPSDKSLELFVPTHESFDTDGSGTQQTFSLSHDLADSPAAAGSPDSTGVDSSPPSRGQADLVLYSDGSRVTPDQVDYDNNQFDYTDGGAVETLDVYYLWKDGSQVNARWESRNGEQHKRVFGSTAAAGHTVKTFSDLEEMKFQNRFEADEKERVRFMINADVSLANWYAGMGDFDSGPNGTRSHAYVRIPVYKTKK